MSNLVKTNKAITKVDPTIIIEFLEKNGFILNTSSGLKTWDVEVVEEPKYSIDTEFLIGKIEGRYENKSIYNELCITISQDRVKLEVVRTPCDYPGELISINPDNYNSICGYSTKYLDTFKGQYLMLSLIKLVEDKIGVFIPEKDIVLLITIHLMRMFHEEKSMQRSKVYKVEYKGGIMELFPVHEWLSGNSSKPHLCNYKESKQLSSNKLTKYGQP